MMDRQKLAISSISLGWHASHTMPRKLDAVKKYGIQGIEMFYTDLVKHAKSQSLSLAEAAADIKKDCTERGIEILCLGSFDDYEGSPDPLDTRLESAREWFQLAHILGTNMIQIPSNQKKDAIGDFDLIVRDLQVLADEGREQGISFAYEALAWGLHVADWEESLRIVQLVDRSNFGLCLDTYHVISRLWADPRAPSGIRPGGHSALRDSIQRFLDTCPREKIFYIQLSDAERLDPPLLPGHPAYNANKDGTHSWCSYGRLFPLDTELGAYFPMLDITKAWLVDSGWSGWVSMEIFHRTMDDEPADPDYWAKGAQTSWQKLVALIGST